MILQREIEAFCKTKPKGPLISAAAAVLKFETAPSGQIGLKKVLHTQARF
jgi:hypothetical protein